VSNAIDWARRSEIADDVLSTPGLTPLVRLKRVIDGADVEILCKLEYFGPSGSVRIESCRTLSNGPSAEAVCDRG
jgi:hypothetical protein